MPCLHAISSLLERDKNQRIGAAGFITFSDNPFFRPIDFEALERKEIEPIFRPSSDKTNFDATYDLEELLLEEAPLEARARRQKPREQLRDDATEQEIRAEELHKMIEALFEPFNYTALSSDRTSGGEATSTTTSTGSTTDLARPPSREETVQPTTPGLRATTPGLRVATPGYSRSSAHSPAGSPPLPPMPLGQDVHAPQQRGDYFGPQLTEPATPQSSSRPIHRQRGSHRSVSTGGGVQVVLNETGSWSEMANQSSAMVGPSGSSGDEKSGKPAGMLGFLSRKKGRDRSPRTKEKERGVIGKEGARVIISNT